MTDAGQVVRAAGCVVWRPTPDGRVEVLVIHRPRYDDWSLPKGKLDPGETDVACAVREVHWEPPDAASRLLSYDHERRVLDSFLATRH